MQAFTHAVSSPCCNSPQQLARVIQYRGRIEGELVKVCSDLLDLLKDKLIPEDVSTDGRVFFHKLAGDYHR